MTKKNGHENIPFLAKSWLSSIEVLLSKDLIDSNISHDENEFVLVNNVLKESYQIVWTVSKLQKVIIQKFPRQKTEE